MADEGETSTTTDHETIRQWAEERDGHPATVADTAEDGEPGVLRFDFEEDEGEESDDEGLTRIDWEEFFAAFEENDLAMLYQEEVEGGETSRFFKFVDRDSAGDEA